MDGQETAAIWTQSLGSHTHLVLVCTFWAHVWFLAEAGVPAFVELRAPRGDQGGKRESHLANRRQLRSGEGGRSGDPAEAPREAGQALLWSSRGRRKKEQVPRRSGELGSKGL